MPRQFTAETVYFLQEGKENLSQCLEVAFRGAALHNIKKIVIFTAEGVGVRQAIEHFLVKDDFKHICLVAVTFPAGKRFRVPDGELFEVKIAEPERALFKAHGVPIVRAHLPFDPVAATWSHHGILGQDLSLVGDALSMFGGSMSLCVQAVALACDSGEVGIGEHVVAMTSDTAVLAQAAPTTRILCDLVVREVLCKPAIFSIGRNENADQLKMGLEEQSKTIEAKAPQVLLPSNPSGSEPK
jgi:uncharacterized protein